jgi:hypothetical protein
MLLAMRRNHDEPIASRSFGCLTSELELPSSGCTLGRWQVAPGRSSSKFEMRIGQHSIMQHIGVGQLLETDSSNPFGYHCRRGPDTRLEHRVEVCELGSHASFAQHDASDVTAEVQRGRPD